MDEVELATAFYPCTQEGEVDTWWEKKREIAREVSSNKDREARLLARSVEGADMNVEPAWRTGAVLEGTEVIDKETGEVKTVRVRAIWRLDGDGKQWKPSLQKC